MRLTKGWSLLYTYAASKALLESEKIVKNFLWIRNCGVEKQEKSPQPCSKCRCNRGQSTSGHLVFCVLSASETGLLLVVKLGRNVVMMRAGVKIMRDARKTAE